MRARPGCFDLVCLDTDNGPGWLVREARLRARFGSVTAAGAHDVVAGRRHDYVMYVALRVD